MYRVRINFHFLLQTFNREHNTDRIRCILGNARYIGGAMTLDNRCRSCWTVDFSIGFSYSFVRRRETVGAYTPSLFPRLLPTNLNRKCAIIVPACVIRVPRSSRLSISFDSMRGFVEGRRRMAMGGEVTCVSFYSNATYPLDQFYSPSRGENDSDVTESRRPKIFKGGGRYFFERRTFLRARDWSSREFTW